MAHDAHTTLQDVVTEIGCLDEKHAGLYLQRMEENNRYQKDNLGGLNQYVTKVTP